MKFAQELIKRAETKKRELFSQKDDFYMEVITIEDLIDITLELENELQLKHFNELLERITKEQQEVRRLLENVRNN